MARPLRDRAAACAVTGAVADALDLAQQMIEHDPCDETDRATALRHYRQYRDVLVAELQCEPSAALTALLKAAG